MTPSTPTRAVAHLPSTATAQECHAALQADGTVIVDSLVDPSVMDQIATELSPWMQKTPTGNDDFTGHRTRRTGALIARSPTFRTLAAHPLVLAVLDAVLGADGRYQLHLTQTIDIGPHETAQVVHRDQWAFDFFPFPKGYEVECHTMWAMTDFTDANGATRVIPGSNHWEDKLRPGLDETVAAEMTRGSVLLYLGSAYHGGGTNRTDERRVGINVGYTRSWLRQEENQYLACPPELARTLDPSLAKLIGYSRAAYALGYVGDTQDPLDWINGRIGDASFSASASASS
jgi:ectoine hydroxylase-related dioxygenase (phytanoyl-CoA dioxygenase family)